MVSKGKAVEYRTVMYSIGGRGEVVVHKLPFNANDKEGREKLKKYEGMGFVYVDLRKGKGDGLPEVLVTGGVELGGSEEVRVSEAEIKVGVEEVEDFKCKVCGKRMRTKHGLEIHEGGHRTGWLGKDGKGKKRKRG